MGKNKEDFCFGVLAFFGVFLAFFGVFWRFLAFFAVLGRFWALTHTRT